MNKGYYFNGELEAAAIYVSQNNKRFSVMEVRNSILTDMHRIIKDKKIKSISTMGYRISKSVDEGNDRYFLSIFVDPALGEVKELRYFEEMEITE